MDDDVVDGAGVRVRTNAVRGFRVHVVAYAIGNGLLVLIDFLTPGSWWFFWPMFGWGIGVAMHWLYVRSVNIDDDWAERRTEDIRQKAYDVGHIEEIEKRYRKSVRAFLPSVALITIVKGSILLGFAMCAWEFK